jgi:hypothetical protein
MPRIIKQQGRLSLLETGFFEKENQIEQLIKCENLNLRKIK